jgi:hypothetical protein
MQGKAEAYLAVTIQKIIARGPELADASAEPGQVTDCIEFLPYRDWEPGRPDIGIAGDMRSSWHSFPPDSAFLASRDGTSNSLLS